MGLMTITPEAIESAHIKDINKSLSERIERALHLNKMAGEIIARNLTLEGGSLYTGNVREYQESEQEATVLIAVRSALAQLQNVQALKNWLLTQFVIEHGSIGTTYTPHQLYVLADFARTLPKN